jgi:hypothetical protein
MRRPGRGPSFPVPLLFALLSVALFVSAGSAGAPGAGSPRAPVVGPFTAVHLRPAGANATDNLTAALNRLLFIVGIAAGAVVTLVWARVALSWFSHDPTRKVQAKERARDALIGSLILVAAVSGLAWALARWVLTGA